MPHRVVAPAACAGFLARDLAAVLADHGAPASAYDYLSKIVTDEPNHVLNTVGGNQPAQAQAKVVLVDLRGLQLDFSRNEIPRATIMLPTGWIGTGSDAPSRLAKLLREYPPNRRVRARVYVRADTVVAFGGSTDPTDRPPYPDETIMAFDGYLVGQSAQGGPGVSLTLTHVLSALADSSTVSNAISPTTAGNLTFRAGISPFIRPFQGATSGAVTMTATGAITLSLGTGKAAETDLWGYWFPASPPTPPPPPPPPPPGTPPAAPPPPPAPGLDRFGIHRYLYALCGQDLFNWAAVGDSNARRCETQDTGNAGALAGLHRIEPFQGVPAAAGSYGGPNAPPGNEASVRAIWKAMETACGPPLDEIDRATLITRSGGKYYTAGYRYGMPASFRLDAAPPAGMGPGMGFAMDLANETLETLGPDTVWNKLVGQILPRYGLALIPMADRGLVVPANPTPNRDWITLSTDEIDNYQESFESVHPVRGTILLGRRTDSAGLLSQGVNPGLGSAALGFGAHAIYDDCGPGQFNTLQAPSWLVGYSQSSWVYGGAILGGRLRAANDAASAVAALAAVTGVRGIASSVGVNPAVPSQPQPQARQAGYRLAKAFTAEARLHGRVVQVSTRLRFDIGPGSAVAVEVPTDRIEPRAANDPARPKAGLVRGIVTKVTVMVDSEAKSASTLLTIQYVRTETEGISGSTADSPHPVWRTSWFGCPLADTGWARVKLSNGSTINSW